MKSVIRTATLSGSLLLAACATTPGSQRSPAVLAGKEWVVEDIGGRGVIDNSHATLLFGQDGRVSGDTSCNRYFADYRVDGTKLQFGNAGVTRRACAPALMDQESKFLAVFNAVNAYRIDSTGALILSTDNGATITAR